MREGAWGGTLAATSRSWGKVCGLLTKMRSSWATSPNTVMAVGVQSPNLPVTPCQPFTESTQLQPTSFEFRSLFSSACWLGDPAGLQRCGKSCRLRWINYLRPGLKRGAFSLQEEDLIIELHSVLGNRFVVVRLVNKNTNCFSSPAINSFCQTCLIHWTSIQWCAAGGHRLQHSYQDGPTMR